MFELGEQFAISPLLGPESGGIVAKTQPMFHDNEQTLNDRSLFSVSDQQLRFKMLLTVIGNSCIVVNVVKAINDLQK